MNPDFINSATTHQLLPHMSEPDFICTEAGNLGNVLCYLGDDEPIGAVSFFLV
jgi:hypothetical protein